MDTEGWWAVAAIAATGLVTAAGWFATRRRNERDDVLQDLQILTQLEPGPVRDRWADSIDTRLQYLADQSERLPSLAHRDIGILAGSFGCGVLLLGLGFEQLRVASVGIVFVGAAAAVWLTGLIRSRPDDALRLQPRRVSLTRRPFDKIVDLLGRRSAPRQAEPPPAPPE